MCFKLAREQVEKAIANETQPGASVNSHAQSSVSPSVIEPTPSADNSSFAGHGEPSSPISGAPVVTTSASNLQPQMTSGSSVSPAGAPATRTNMDEIEASVNTVKLMDAGAGSDGAAVADVNTPIIPTYNPVYLFSSF